MPKTKINPRRSHRHSECRVSIVQLRDPASRDPSGQHRADEVSEVRDRVCGREVVGQWELTEHAR
jgi:hypothetical protein